MKTKPYRPRLVILMNKNAKARRKAKTAKKSKPKLPPVEFPKGTRVLVKLTSTDKRTPLRVPGVVVATRVSGIDRSSRVYNVSIEIGVMMHTFQYQILQKTRRHVACPVGLADPYVTATYSHDLETYPEGK